MAKRSLESKVKDSVEKINDEVAVGEDLEFQERWWRFESAVWIFFAVVLVATFLGVFGRGPLASGTLQNDDMKIRYERISRTGTSALMEIELSPSAIQNGKVNLYVSESVVKQLGAQRIIPQPAESVIGNGGLTYTFAATQTPASIKFGMQPDGPGVYRMAIGLPGKQPLEAKVVVMP